MKPGSSDPAFSLQLRFCLFHVALFFGFGSIFTDLGRFRKFLGTDFPLFVVFSIPGDGILANESRGRTIAHPEKVLKRANWAPEVAVLSMVCIWA
jgi:hypothetical protein